MKKIVFTFGRMNPPTIGHAKLVDKVQSVAKSEKADARVYLSHTSVQDDPKNKKDPLNYKQKIKYAKKAFGSIVKQSNSKTVFQIMSEMEKDGYTDVIMVVGSDRVPEFKKLLDKYNGKDYDFDSISIVSAGERDPDATGVEGMSASKLRALAVDGDFDTFKKGLPKGLNDRDAKEIFDTINKFIKESIEEERKPLTIAQRQAKARMMKRLAPKIARFRKMKAKRMADREALAKRAQKAARNVIRKKVAGERGTDYSALSASEKITIDKLVAKKSAIIKKLAKKLMPKVRKAEMERLKKARSQKNEVADWTEEDFNTLAEECFLMIEKEEKEREKEVAQDPDVKDLPGTQPKKYYKGLSDKEKEARAKQFKRQAKKDDDDPSAYKAPPSNKDAKTKPSKYTKKYHQMFGEGAVEDTRERHKREKEALRQQHDSEMDAARLQDARAKNQQTEEVELSEDSAKALKKKSEKSGIPVGILRQVYNRGMAAWKTGHRPGATQQQWAYARVNSFITGGKTRTTADADLWKKAKASKAKKEEVELDEMLKKEGSKWVLYSKDGSKKLGEFDTKEDALKRERQIQYFKHQNEAVSPAQQAAIAISKKERGEKPKKKKLNSMLAVPTARPPSQFGEESLEEMPRWLLEPLSKITHKKGYKMAKKVLADVLARKKKEAGKKGLQHSVEYYAAQIAKQFDGVDARVLADMVNEEPEQMDAPEIGTDKIRKRYADMTPGQITESFQTPKSAGTGHTMFAGEFLKIQGAYEHHPDVEEELERRASSKKTQISEAIEYHKENGLSIKENIFRPHSEAYYAFFRECRRLWENGELEVTDRFDKTLLESDAGLVAMYEGMEVPLDIPLIEAEYQGKDVDLNKPMRGGAKKFYVYVKDGDKVKKVSFGGTTGLKVKLDDKEARKNFASRHNCDTANDKTTPRYWSCRLPYYAKELGLEGGGSFFW